MDSMEIDGRLSVKLDHRTTVEARDGVWPHLRIGCIEIGMERELAEKIAEVVAAHRAEREVGPSDTREDDIGAIRDEARVYEEKARIMPFEAGMHYKNGFAAGLEYAAKILEMRRDAQARAAKIKGTE